MIGARLALTGSRRAVGVGGAGVAVDVCGGVRVGVLVDVWVGVPVGVLLGVSAGVSPDPFVGVGAGVLVGRCVVCSVGRSVGWCVGVLPVSCSPAARLTSGVAVPYVTPLNRRLVAVGVGRRYGVTAIAGVGRVCGCGRWRSCCRKTGKRAA